MSDDHPLRVGSLFSGYLGLDQGIAAAFADLFGIETRLAWASDIEPGPCKVIAYRHPDVPNLGDITAIDWHTVPEVDLIGGGSPCFPAGTLVATARGYRPIESIVEGDLVLTHRGRYMPVVQTMNRFADDTLLVRAQGAPAFTTTREHPFYVRERRRAWDNSRRRYITGTRSNLWTVMRDAIATLEPMFVVWENVGAALSTKAASASLPDHLDRAIDHHLAVAQETHHAPTATRHTRAAHRLMEYRTRRLGVPYPKPALRALGRVLGDLASLGYDAVWHSNRAADIGAPHARRRVFLVAANPRGQSWIQRRLAAASQAPRGGALRQPSGRDRAPVSLLLPTPMASDAAAAADLTRNTPQLRAIGALLLTPTATQPGGTAANHLRKKPGRQQVTDLGMIVEQGLLETGGRLLPTPSVADAMGGHTHQAWGPYQAAIARWETVNGPAPSPTKPGRNGNPKLNPAFAAWMMGAPAGWFTDVPGITDNEALKLAGNGVVPQQAAAALAYCLHTFLKRDQP